MNETRNVARELRGLGRIVVEATKDATTVVEDMHQALAGPFRPVVKHCTGGVYGLIRNVTGFVGKSVDWALEQVEPLVEDYVPPDGYDVARAVLNGVIGDYLEEEHNPLAMQTRLRIHDGSVEARNNANGRIVIYVHGSSMDDVRLTRGGHNHAEALREDLGITPVYAVYNSGLHISLNGRRLAEQIELLIKDWPVPVESLIFLGFSMGGLVARSAVHIAEQEELFWRQKLSAMIFIGTPHHGAPLERWGNIFETALGLSSYSAPLRKVARLRSSGVTDLRYGIFLDEHWQGRDRFKYGRDPRVVCGLPDVPCFAIAGSTSHLFNRTPYSDGLVPINSALGIHKSSPCDLKIPSDHQLVVASTRHLDLLSSPEVYAQIRAWISGLDG